MCLRRGGEGVFVTWGGGCVCDGVGGVGCLCVGV